MISATCCRCGCKLDKKGGVLLRAPEGEDEERFDGLLGDGVVKLHLCASCMPAILGWLRTEAARASDDRTKPLTPKTTTTHVLFEGHALCGFMVWCLPTGGGWPDGHNWVSIAEVMMRKDGASIPTNGTCKPCDQCLRFASASALSRYRA